MHVHVAPLSEFYMIGYLTNLILFHLHCATGRSDKWLIGTKKSQGKYPGLFSASTPLHLVHKFGDVY